MYQLLFTLKRKKGIQVHVYDHQEDFIHLLYLNPVSFQPKETISTHLKLFLVNKKAEIMSGKYMLNSSVEVETSIG